MSWIAAIVARYRVMPIFLSMMPKVLKDGRATEKEGEEAQDRAVCRFVYDRKMPVDYLEFLVDAFDINRDELVPGDKHLNLEDLSHLPNPNRGNEAPVKPVPMKLNYLDEKESIFRYVNKRDLLLHFPIIRLTILSISFTKRCTTLLAKRL